MHTANTGTHTHLLTHTHIYIYVYNIYTHTQQGKREREREREREKDRQIETEREGGQRVYWMDERNGICRDGRKGAGDRDIIFPLWKWRRNCEADFHFTTKKKINLVLYGSINQVLTRLNSAPDADQVGRLSQEGYGVKEGGSATTNIKK